MANTLNLRPESISAIVVGDSKSGKTRFAGTWPKPAMASFDGSMSALAGQDIEYEVFMDHDRYKPHAYRDFMKWLDGLITAVKTGKSLFKTLVLDNLTYLARWTMYDIQYMHRTIDKPAGYEGYRMLKSRLQDVVVKAKTAGLHVLATAEPKLEKDELTGEIETYPAIEGSYREEVIADFDMAFFMKVGRDMKTKKPTYMMQTVPDHRIKCAGSRWDCGLEVMEVPDFKVIMDKITARFPNIKGGAQ